MSRAVHLSPRRISTTEVMINMAIASFSLSKTSFGCSDIGQDTVLLTATDNYGNIASQTAIVTVQGIKPGNHPLFPPIQPFVKPAMRFNDQCRFGKPPINGTMKGRPSAGPCPTLYTGPPAWRYRYFATAPLMGVPS